MPALLRMFCQGAMVAPPLLLLFLVIPLGDWTVDGKPMTYTELWKSGTGVVLAVALFLAALGAWGIAARVQIARWAWVATPLVPVLLLPVFPALSAGSASSSAGTVGAALVTSIVIYGALFHVTAVRRYFRQGFHRAGA